MGTGGLSKVRLDRLHAVMAGYVDRGEVPGVVALVERRGETYVEAIGTLELGDTPDVGRALDLGGRADVGGSRPVARDSIFRISSMTKPIVAAATMVLVEECVLRLDDPVDRFLPELADRRVLTRLDGPLDGTVPARRPISVRDLLTFRMGFGQVFAPPDGYPILRAANEREIGMGPPNPARTPEPDEWLRRLGELPLMYQPGERWMYNTGSDVLGVLIARATGQPLETFLAERIFDPLGMADTGFSVPADRLDRFATSYWSSPGTGAVEVYDEAAGGRWSRPPAFPSGAGGLVSTIDDYLAFARLLMDNGVPAGRRILSRPSVAVMTTDHLTPEQKAVSGLVPGFFDARGWGFGVAVVTRRDDVAGSVGTFGWDGGLGTSWYCDPAEDMVIILMTQRAWTSPSPPDICLDFRTLAYQAIDD